MKNKNVDPKKIYTYKSHPEYFDNKALLGDNIRYSDLVKKRIYAGTHGYNPTTGEMVKLKIPVSVNSLNKLYSKRKENRTTEEDEEFKRQHRRNVAFQDLEKFYRGHGLVPGLIATAGTLGPAALANPYLQTALTGYGFYDATTNSIPSAVQAAKDGRYLDAAGNAGMAALDVLPIPYFGTNVLNDLSPLIKNIPSYGKDFYKTSVDAGKIKLPTYKDVYRWQPDKIPESLISSGKNLSKEQQTLTGSWYSSKPNLNFYLRTRPGPGDILKYRLPEYQIKNLKENMPLSAKYMSGKDAKLKDKFNQHPDELILTKQLRDNLSSKSRFDKIRFDINPNEYLDISDKSKEFIKNFNFEKEDLGYKNILDLDFNKNFIEPLINQTKKSKYLPYKNGGTVMKNKSLKKNVKPTDSYLSKMLNLDKYAFGSEMGNAGTMIFDASSQALMGLTTNAVSNMIATAMGKSNKPKVFDFTSNQNPVMKYGGKMKYGYGGKMKYEDGGMIDTDPPRKKLGKFAATVTPQDQKFLTRLQKKYGDEAMKEAGKYFMMPGEYDLGVEGVQDDAYFKSQSFASPEGYTDKTYKNPKYFASTPDVDYPQIFDKYFNPSYTVDEEAKSIGIKPYNRKQMRQFFKRYANGGTINMPIAEVEGGEVYEKPNGEVGMFVGDNHGQDTDGDGFEGIPVTEQETPAGTKIFSKRLKDVATGDSFAESKLKREKRIKGAKDALKQRPFDVFLKNLLKQEQRTADIQEEAQEQIQDAANALEQGKQMAEDIVAMNYKYGGLMKYMNGGIMKYPNGGKVNPFNVSLGMGDVNAGFDYTIPKTNLGFSGNLNQQLTPLFTEGIMPTPTGSLEARFGNKDGGLNFTGSLETDFKNKPITSFRGEYNPSSNFSASGGFTGQDDNLSGDLSLNYTGKKFSAGANVSGNKEGFAVGGDASYEIMPGTNIGIDAKYAKNEQGKYEPTGNISLTSDFRRNKKERPLEFSKGGMIPKYANGTSGLPPGFNPALLYQVPQFAKLAKEEQDRLLGSPEMLSQYVKKNVPSAFDKKMSNYADEIEGAIAEYNIQSKPLNSGAYDSGLEMFGDQLFEVVPDNFRGITPTNQIQPIDLGINVPKSIDPKLDFSKLQGTTDVRPVDTYSTTQIDPITGVQIPNTQATLGQADQTGNLSTTQIQPITLDDLLQNEDLLTAKTLEEIEQPAGELTSAEKRAYDFTLGDIMGFSGTGIAGTAPMLTTLINRAGDTPNINAYQNFGKQGLAERERLKGFMGRLRDENLRDIGLKADTQKKLARSGARGINQLRALGELASAQEQEMVSNINAKYAEQMAGISDKIASAMDVRDRMTSIGREKQDLADRQDRDNFFTQLNKDFGNMGKAIQKMGKDLNIKQFDKDFLDILEQTNKYGIGQRRNKDGKFEMYSKATGETLSAKEVGDLVLMSRKQGEETRKATDKALKAAEKAAKKQNIPVTGMGYQSILLGNQTGVNTNPFDMGFGENTFSNQFGNSNYDFSSSKKKVK